MYSSTLGRWIKEDPLGSPDGTNRFEWEMGNPITFLDPYGLESAVGVAMGPGGGTAVGLGGAGATGLGRGGVVMGPGGIATVIASPGAGGRSGNGGAMGRAVFGSNVGAGGINFGGGGASNPVFSFPLRPPVLPPPPSQTENTSASQLEYLQSIGRKFAQQDASWGWFNQCDDQSANLQMALTSDAQWQGTRPKMWVIGTTGGTGSFRVWRHNVVLLTPINGNPLSPVILDSFHFYGSDRDCMCRSAAGFNADYPDPIDADSWWLVILKQIATLKDP